MVQNIQDKRVRNPLNDYDDSDDYVKDSEKRHYENVIQASNPELYKHPDDR